MRGLRNFLGRLTVAIWLILEDGKEKGRPWTKETASFTPGQIMGICQIELRHFSPVRSEKCVHLGLLRSVVTKTSCATLARNTLLQEPTPMVGMSTSEKLDLVGSVTHVSNVIDVMINLDAPIAEVQRDLMRLTRVG